MKSLYFVSNARTVNSTGDTWIDIIAWWNIKRLCVSDMRTMCQTQWPNDRRNFRCFSNTHAKLQLLCSLVRCIHPYEHSQFHMLGSVCSYPFAGSKGKNYTQEKQVLCRLVVHGVFSLNKIFDRIIRVRAYRFQFYSANLLFLFVSRTTVFQCVC